MPHGPEIRQIYGIKPFRRNVKMNYEKIIYEEFKKRTCGQQEYSREVERAEKEFQRVYNKVKETDSELAFEVDEAAGRIARAYELEGFINGLKN